MKYYWIFSLALGLFAVTASAENKAGFVEVCAPEQVPILKISMSHRLCQFTDNGEEDYCVLAPFNILKSERRSVSTESKILTGGFFAFSKNGCAVVQGTVDPYSMKSKDERLADFEVFRPKAEAANKKLHNCVTEYRNLLIAKNADKPFASIRNYFTGGGGEEFEPNDGLAYIDDSATKREWVNYVQTRVMLEDQLVKRDGLIKQCQDKVEAKRRELASVDPRAIYSGSKANPTIHVGSSASEHSSSSANADAR